MTSARWKRVPWRNRPSGYKQKSHIKLIYRTIRTKNVLKREKKKNHWKETHLPTLAYDIYQYMKITNIRKPFNVIEFVSLLYVCTCVYAKSLYTTHTHTHTHTICMYSCEYTYIHKHIYDTYIHVCLCKSLYTTHTDAKETKICTCNSATTFSYLFIYNLCKV